jgi:glycosyltransferase involved in cell wall biosynthesis
MRVFKGLVEIAGYYSDIAEGLRSLGINTSLVCFSENKFGYERGLRADGFMMRVARYAFTRRASTKREAFLGKLFWVALSEACRAAVFLWAVARHKVFVFGFGQSFYAFRELPILKVLRRRVICVYNGSDCRPPYIDGALLNADPELARDPSYLYVKTLDVKRKVDLVDRYADVVVSAPPQALFETKAFVLFQAVGVPVRKPESIQVPEPTSRRAYATRILHCPSRPEAKGTPLIRASIESLKRKGHAIDYIEVTGKPNAVVLGEVARCDFVVDHLYSDSPAGTFVAEAAFFGKPAVLAGYCQPFVESLPAEYVPPVVYCSPDRIEIEIERLITDAALRENLGARARAFVETHWTPVEFAKRFLLLIESRIPTAWLCDPKKIDFVPIAGMSEAKACAIIGGLIDTYGPRALQLQDKPELERLFLGFARTGKRGRAGAAA